MNTTLTEIAPETVHLLTAQAAASGLSVNDYLKQLLGGINGSLPVSSAATDDSVNVFMADIESLADGTEHLPPSSITYSREDIYFDHD